MRSSPPSSSSSSRSPTSAMSHFASNFASLAKSKLQSALSSGSRDNLSLHRWVLLKNSIIRDGTATASPNTPTEEHEIGAPSLVPDALDAEDDDEDELDNLDDGDFFNFLFPDPGYGAEGSQDAATIATEAQWFDSLLETLGDDEDDDSSHHHHLPTAVKLITQSETDNHLYRHQRSSSSSSLLSEPASPASSYSDEYSLASPLPIPSPPLQSIAVPYPVPYPPLVKPYGAAPAAQDDDADADDEPCYYAPRARPAAPSVAAPYFLPYNDLEDSYLSMPDAMEDSASSEDDDTEPLPATPFSRSRSSFSLSNSDEVVTVDPASVPLPGDHHHHHRHHHESARGRHSSGGMVGMGAEPRIYSAADDVFSFDPNPGMPSVDVEAPPVYRPFFYQNC